MCASLNTGEDIDCADLINYNPNNVEVNCYDAYDDYAYEFCNVPLGELFEADTDLVPGGVASRINYHGYPYFDTNDDSCTVEATDEYNYYLENDNSDETNIYECCQGALAN